MNKFKILSPLLCILLSTTSFAEETKIKVVGHIKGLKTNQVMITNNYRDELAVGVSDKGKFELEFKVDLDKNIQFHLYIPGLNEYGNSSFNWNTFYTDVNEVRLTGKLKGDKITNFIADTPMNNDYRKFKFAAPSTKLRLKADNKAEKAYIEYSKYKNPTGRGEDMRRPEDDPKSKELYDKSNELRSKLSDINYKCTMETVEMLTSTHNKGLNALIWSMCNSMNVKSAKPAIEKYLNLYSEDEIEKDYYVKELVAFYRYKAIKVKGEDIIDYDFIDLKGEKVNFADFKGKYLYVNFYDVKHEESLDELTIVQKLEKLYKNKDIVFVQMNLNKDKDSWKKYCKENNLVENQINVNAQTKFFRDYRLKDLPRGILIDKDSKTHTYYVGKTFGYVDEKNR